MVPNEKEMSTPRGLFKIPFVHSFDNNKTVVPTSHALVDN